MSTVISQPPKFLTQILPPQGPVGPTGQVLQIDAETASLQVKINQANQKLLKI